MKKIRRRQEAKAAVVAPCEKRAAEELAAHRVTVRSFLLRLTRDEALADDLVQETLLRASRAMANYRQDASLSTWLSAIALNLVRDHLRAAKRKPQTVSLNEAGEMSSGDQPEDQTLEAEMSTCILGHVERLPKRQCRAVLLHHFAGFNHREIAGQIGVSEGNARIILHRGLAALRRSLQDGCHLDFSNAIPCERR